MSKKINLILIILCTMMTFGGIAIGGVINADSKLTTHTVVTVKNETSKTLKAELHGFYPGNTQSFDITLDGERTEDYSVTINFRDKNGGRLENYLTVVITTADLKIEKTLKELLEGGEISLGKNADSINICYTMPENTGNESQGTSAVFYIDLTAKKAQ